jgi:ribosomal protein S18 acetylase RimI-like enzyme
MRRVCLGARAAGVEVMRLEVAVENDRALGLYTSLGFARVATEDYWRLPAT